MDFRAGEVCVTSWLVAPAGVLRTSLAERKVGFVSVSWKSDNADWKGWPCLLVAGVGLGAGGGGAGELDLEIAGSLGFG